MSNKPKTHLPIYITEKVKERFFKMVQKTQTCWNWTGAVNPSGHAVIKIDRRNRGAHRVSYTIHIGDIPEDLMILHSCHNPKCVNPEHLRPGTAKDNAEDEVKRQNTRHYKCANPTQYNGVRWDDSRKGWISYVYIEGKMIDIGRHINEVDAARNHDRILFMKYKKRDTLNFIDEYNLD
jgi:hypothetical protein